MKGKLVAVGMIACFMLSLTASQASANVLTENVLYAEGVDYLGLDAIPTAGPPSVAIGEAKDVMVGWSDDIIYHQFPAGQKVRTEVLLHVVAVDSEGKMVLNDTGCAIELYAVYTLTAHFMIQKLTLSDNDDNKILSGSGTAYGVEVGKSIALLTVYGGFQLEKSKWDVESYKYTDPATNISAQLQGFSVNGRNTSRFHAGIRMLLLVINIHADYSFATQPVITAGVGVSFR